MAGLKMAKSSPEEMEKMLEFFNGLEAIFDGEFEQSDWGDYEEEKQEAVGKYVAEWWEKFLDASWARFYWGFDTMLRSAADPDLTYLDWKPEINRVLESQPELLAACETTLEWLLYHGYDESDSLIERLKTIITQAKPIDTAVEETAVQHDYSTLYYIVNEAYSKNGTACFWKPNSSGYTSNVKDAGKYTRAECEKVQFASDLLFLPVDQVTPEVCMMVVPDMVWLAHAQKLPKID